MQVLLYCTLLNLSELKRTIFNRSFFGCLCQGVSTLRGLGLRPRTIHCFIRTLTYFLYTCNSRLCEAMKKYSIPNGILYFLASLNKITVGIISFTIKKLKCNVSCYNVSIANYHAIYHYHSNVVSYNSDSIKRK